MIIRKYIIDVSILTLSIIPTIIQAIKPFYSALVSKEMDGVWKLQLYRPVVP